jgi:ABC-2 type transport system ATP-binding protein
VSRDGGPATVVVDGLSRWFAGVVAVNEVSLEIEPGVTALLGPNGAGKTTLLRAIAGLIEPSQGTVRVFGEPPRGNVELYRRIGYMPEHESVYDFLTGRQFVRLAARLQALDDVEGAVSRAIDTVDLVAAQHRRLGEYSRGMRQRMRLAATLVHDPPLLLLDEPRANLDPAAAELLEPMIGRGSGRTRVLVSHDVESALAESDAVLGLRAGRQVVAEDADRVDAASLARALFPTSLAS